mgnify:CR=1 FL=1
MSDAACFGVEYFDDDGSECPFLECVARIECKKICESAQGIIHDRLVRIKSEEVTKKKIEKEYKKQEKEKIKKKVLKITKGIERKVGYTKAKRLDYKNEGCLRDQMIDHVEAFLKGTTYTMKRTRYIQSVSSEFKGPLTTSYLFKISTTRKKSILVYINEDLSNKVDAKKFVCRQLYEYEKLCFPNYLEWVVIIDSLPKLDLFLGYLDI